MMNVRLVRIAFTAVACMASGSACAVACGDQKEVPAQERVSHRLHWNTRSEMESAGFEIYRSQSRDDGFVKITTELIPAAKFSNRPRTYEYRDSDIDPCGTYFYYIDAVSTNGVRTRVSETLMAKPKAVAGKDGSGAE